jgi:hypothetical protein
VLLFVIVLVAVSIAVFAAITSSGSDAQSDKKKATDTEEGRAEAFLLCKKTAAETAKYPSSVDVSVLSSSTDLGTDGKWYVGLDYTAMNDFGAHIPYHITCKVSRYGSVLEDYSVATR